MSACLQSGGMSQDLIRLGALRGLRFGKVVSYGNAIDLNECDFLDYFADDPKTKVIMCYMEGVKDGKRFFRTLRRRGRKEAGHHPQRGPDQGGKSGCSFHTASLAGASSIWSTLTKQAGAIMAHDFEDWIDLGVGFSMIPPIRGPGWGSPGEAKDTGCSMRMNAKNPDLM